MKKWMAALALFLAIVPGLAQRRDSVYTASEQFRWYKLTAPAVLVAAGTAGTLSTWYRENVNMPVRDWALAQGHDKNSFNPEDALQYTPYVGYLGAALFGCGEHGAWEKLMASGTAILFTLVVNGSIKYLAGVERPNGANRQSFPSGHTATAFLGAELVRLEYGPWWGLAAYSFALYTGIMRVYHNRHWTTDVLAGAGFGILGANIGYWLLPYERKLFGVDAKKSKLNIEAVPYACQTPVGSCYGASLSLRF